MNGKSERLISDFNLGIIFHLQTVIQINFIYFCLGKRDTGSGPPIVMGFGPFGQIVMGFGQISTYFFLLRIR